MEIVPLNSLRLLIRLRVCRKSGNCAFKQPKTTDTAQDSLHRKITHRDIYTKVTWRCLQGTTPSLQTQKSYCTYICKSTKFNPHLLSHGNSSYLISRTIHDICLSLTIIITITYHEWIISLHFPYLPCNRIASTFHLIC